MKVNELMVGDWVICNHYQDKPFTKQFGVADFVKGEYEFCEPIPLTEDILVKNGFEVHPFGCEWRQEKGIDFQNYIVVYFRRNGEPRKVELCFVNKVNTEVRDIKYVHQLQHLLRLCGIKKEIEL